ncbi:uncharacterized protein LOC131023220 [Salvia miltiorrhiza]|uniref:uncharacterized protein LOC131023220 n=1 Tax=Salvia miltiorrhiza TaxID=226208 RepID=UPI0025ABA29D|nr:uncharacterized protein LOC131023220 [Salvia miltiorrhiza]
MEEIRARHNFEGCLVVDSVGRSGGLCMLWKSNTSCTLIGYSRNHIDLHIMDVNGEWRLTGFYGFSERHKRRDSWNLLRRLAGISSLPWFIIGDFNDLLDPGDKQGRVHHPNWLFEGFRSATLDCGLSDLPLHGYPFTWSRGLNSNNFVEERLDRGMAFTPWKTLFPNATLCSLLAPMSDHTPILLKCQGLQPPAHHKRFWFENKWCLEPNFPHIVCDCWTNLRGITITERLTAVSDSISTWAAHLRRNEQADKTRLQKKIQSLQGRHDTLSMQQKQSARKELAAVYLREETHWKQQAKQHWLKDGDYNS